MSLIERVNIPAAVEPSNGNCEIMSAAKAPELRECEQRQPMLSVVFLIGAVLALWTIPIALRLRMDSREHSSTPPIVRLGHQLLSS
jgi:hypothetical protein